VRAPSTFNRTSSADAASQVQIQTQPFGPWKSSGPWNPRTPTQPNPTLAQFREICLIFLVVYFQPGFRHITRRLWDKTRYPSTQYLPTSYPAPATVATPPTLCYLASGQPCAVCNPYCEAHIYLAMYKNDS
jgi:hypothetical protein